MTVFISADWGGSKVCGICIKDETTHKSFEFAAANIRTISVSHLDELINSIRKTAEVSDNEDVIWCISAAGASDPIACKRLANSISIQTRTKGQTIVIPDTLGNHYAAFAGKDGILSVAGTGSIQFARYNDKVAVAGGYGFLLDETPSAAFFGQRALINVLEYHEGLSHQKSFAEIFEQFFYKPDRERIINDLYRADNYQQHLGTFSKAITYAFDQNISHVRLFVENSFKKLARQLENLIKRTNNKKPAICPTGGLVENWSSYHAIFDAALESSGISYKYMKPEFNKSLGPLIYLAQKDRHAQEIFIRFSGRGKNHD